MGKKSGRKAAQRLARSMCSPNTVGGPEKPKTGIPAMVSPPQQPDFFGAATAPAAVAAVAAPPAHKASAQAVRATEKAALPTLSGSTGLRAVENCITVAMVPLCCGDAAAAVLNEKSKLRAINEANEVMKNVVHGLLKKANAQIDIYTISPKRAVDVKVARRSSSKNGRSGIFKIRVLAGFEVHLAKALEGHILCELDTVRAYELDVDAAAYPSSVVQELYTQAGVRSTLKMAFGRSEMETYMFEMTEEQAELFAGRGYVAELGRYGKVQFRLAEIKLTQEHCWAYGVTGVGSAQLDLQPEFARATACSTDLVNISGVPSAKRGMGVLVDIAYPFSVENYDAVCRLLAIGEFQLVNPRTGTTLEITLAESPIEMQKKLGVQLVNTFREEEDSSDEEEAQSLAAISGARCLLVPAADWRWRREAAAAATMRGERLAAAARRSESLAAASDPHTGWRGHTVAGLAGGSPGGADTASLTLSSGFTSGFLLVSPGSTPGFLNSLTTALPLHLPQDEPELHGGGTGPGSDGGPSASAADGADAAGPVAAAAMWWEERGMQRAPPRWAQRARSGRHGK